MDQEAPEKPTIRFLSFSNDREDAEKEAKLKEAAARIEKAIAREKALGELIDVPLQRSEEEVVQPENDTRSLYERLQEQRNRKQESLDEAKKLSNYISHLDEDDANYLNEVAQSRREEELRKRLEVQDALEAKKQLDEQKMLDQERKMKETLLGTGAQDSRACKSRLSSLIKVKSKPKARSETDSEMPKNAPSKNPGALPSGSSSSAPSLPKRPHDSSVDEELEQSPPRKRSLDRVARKDVTTTQEIDKDVDDGEVVDKQSHSHECNCKNKVTRVLGVLPSSLIVRADPRDSDDTDYSDDDPDPRLILTFKKRRR